MMIFKILLFPFLLMKNCIGALVLIFRVIFSLITKVCRFSFGRVFGTVFGALIGALGGRRHLRVKWFPQKK
jgi:hypothetical protein